MDEVIILGTPEQADRSGRARMRDRQRELLNGWSRLTVVLRKVDAARGELLGDLYDQIRNDVHERTRQGIGITSDTSLEIESVLAELSLEWRKSNGAVRRLFTTSVALRYGVELRNATATPIDSHEVAGADSQVEIAVGDVTICLQSVRDAWHAGLIDGDHASVIVEQLTLLNHVSVEQAETFRDQLLELAMTLTPHQLHRRATQLREIECARSLAEAHRQAFMEREVRLTPLPDGMAQLTIISDAVTLVAACNRSTLIAKRVQNTEAEADKAGRRTGGVRTLQQLRTDMMTELLLGGVTVDSSTQHTTGSNVSSHVQATVTVTVPALTLMGQPGTRTGEAPAELDGYGPIAAATARHVIARSLDEEFSTGKHQSWFRILTHPATGVPLVYDRETYSPPASLRRHIQQRDGTCRFPGCHRPSRQCDIDHTIDWQFDGVTNADNLACLCRRHHTMKHHTDWNVEQIGAGKLQWTSPTGATYVTTPNTSLPVTRLKQLPRKHARENTEPCPDPYDAPPF